MHLRSNCSPIVFVVLYTASALCLVSRGAAAGDWSGYVAAEARLFLEDNLYPGQHDSHLALSLSFEPEYYHEWPDRNESLTFIPFVRVDQQDDDRTHFDLREFYWEKAAQKWELRVGVNKVFWGVIESVHLVDVINQTDFIEDIDTEDKLGQPMLNFALVRDWGTLDFFALPGFRKRTFPGRDGRLRGPIQVDTDNPDFESDLEEWHTDWAVRWSQTMGDWDLGLSYFYGTARDPRLELRTNTAMQTVLTPVYDLIHQGGIDAQWIVGGWAWKLEGIVRTGQEKTFSAVAAGFEYTLYGVFGSAMDIGLLAEYLGNTRGSGGPSPTDNDVFVGTRFGFNDVQSTAVLAGAIVDLETGAAFWNLEASRRLGESWTIEVQGRAFSDIPPDDPTFAIRRDDYVEVELAYHF